MQLSRLAPACIRDVNGSNICPDTGRRGQGNDGLLPSGLSPSSKHSMTCIAYLKYEGQSVIGHNWKRSGCNGVADAHAHLQRLVSVVEITTVLEEYTTEEQSAVVRFL
jgi:hypothetical protein